MRRDKVIQSGDSTKLHDSHDSASPYIHLDLSSQPDSTSVTTCTAARTYHGRNRALRWVTTKQQCRSWLVFPFL